MYSRPKVSIIIPVYNVEKYLETCLNSVAAQTLKETEVIVVDDGSTDQSSRIIEKFKQRYSHFICLSQSNQGVSAARRNGLARSEGETVLFIDADDFIPSTYCERLYNALQANGADMSVGPLVRYYTDTRQAVPEDMAAFSRSCLEGEKKTLLFSNFPAVMALCGKLIRRELWDSTPLTFSSYPTGEDICPSIQLIACAKKIAPVKEAVRLVCLLSFMEMYGLSAQEEKLLTQNRQSLLLPARLFKKRNLRFRARVKLLKWCLRAGISYARCMRQVRRSRRWLFKEK